VFQAADERLGGLIPTGLALGFAGIAQHNAENPGLASSTTRRAHRCSAAKIGLGFLPDASITDVCDFSLVLASRSFKEIWRCYASRHLGDLSEAGVSAYNST
ncbi:MAG TPA: hypothetical protein VK639_22040, partial [Terriglobales bacterium]|nr:hypothetical protein [Terriglobales bacterium]